MAGPFDIFRKNQKVLLVCASILAIVAFTLGDAVSMLGRGSRGGGDPANTLIASSKYGDLRAYDLGRLEAQRRIARDFMTMAMLATPNGRNPYFAQRYQQYWEQMFPLGDRELVLAHLLARRGAEMGLRISDDVVLDFVRSNTDDQLSDKDYQDILARFGGRREGKVGEPQLFDALRNEILIGQTRDILLGAAVPGVQGVSIVGTDFGVLAVKPTDTPAERWKYYQRLHRKINGEAVAVKVEDFIAQVSEPSESQLRDFFEQHKDKEPVPGSPEPGFKVPYKAAFQYVVADLAKFRAAVKVTDEEIQKHYEENKDVRYRKAKWDADFSLDAKTPGSGGETSDAEKTEGAAAAESADDQPAAETREAGDAATPDESASTDAAQKEAATPAKDEQGSTETNETPSEADATKPSGASILRRARSSIAAALTPGASLGFLQTDESADKKAGDPASQEASASASGEAAATEKTADESSTEPVASKDTAPYTPIGSDLLLKPSVDDVEYRPLSEVYDAIRNEIEGRKAREALEKAIETAREQADTYASSRELWEINKDEPGTTFKEPAPLDLDKLATESGLTAGKTPMLSAFEANDFPGLGDSTAPNGARFVQIAFFSRIVMFRPQMTTSIDGDRYLFWKTEERDAYVPEFADIKSDVERSWRMIHARDKALEEANRIAEAARKSPEGGLAAAAGERKPFEFQPFSWLRMNLAGRFTGQAQVAQSEVKEVEDAGPAFLQLATTLSEGEVGVAMNNPQTIAYVVLATRVSPVEDALRAMFIVDRADRYQPAANQDLYPRLQAFEQQLIADARLTFAPRTEQPATQQ